MHNQDIMEVPFHAGAEHGLQRSIVLDLTRAQTDLLVNLGVQSGLSWHPGSSSHRFLHPHQSYADRVSGGVSATAPAKAKQTHRHEAAVYRLRTAAQAHYWG